MEDKELAQQLRKPNGETGIKIGEMMAKGNATFYRMLEDFLAEYHAKRILEVGFGLGKHIPALFEKKRIEEYMGVDFSPSLVDFAKRNYQQYNGRFILEDVNNRIDMEAKVDMVFTSNTIYFCDDLNAVFSNYSNWVGKGGIVVLGKRSESDLSTHLWNVAQHGFINHSHEAILSAAQKSGLFLLKHVNLKEYPWERNGQEILLSAEFLVFAKA